MRWSCRKEDDIWIWHVWMEGLEGVVEVEVEVVVVEVVVVKVVVVEAREAP